MSARWPANSVVGPVPADTSSSVSYTHLTALEKFKGTLSFDSHDREFISSLATRILEIRLDGKVVNYLGNYEEYLASQGIA